MGRSIETGKDSMGRSSDGMGACAGITGLCRDGLEVRVTSEFRMWIDQSESCPLISSLDGPDAEVDC